MSSNLVKNILNNECRCSPKSRRFECLCSWWQEPQATSRVISVFVLKNASIVTHWLNLFGNEWALFLEFSLYIILHPQVLLRILCNFIEGRGTSWPGVLQHALSLLICISEQWSVIDLQVIDWYELALLFDCRACQVLFCRSPCFCSPNWFHYVQLGLHQGLTLRRRSFAVRARKHLV